MTDLRTRTLTTVTNRLSDDGFNDWRRDGACAPPGVDAAAFWPSDDDRSRTKWDAAKDICATCPIVATCLEYAMTVERGTVRGYRASVYGGLSPREREELDIAGWAP